MIITLLMLTLMCNAQSELDDINKYFIKEIHREEVPSEARSKNLEFIESIYVIYAERNDSLFKIIATEDLRIDISLLDTIKENEYYHLDLVEFTPGEYDIPFENSGYFLGIEDGYLIQIPFERVYNNMLYTASNLNGLYLKK